MEPGPNGELAVRLASRKKKLRQLPDWIEGLLKLNGAFPCANTPPMVALPPLFSGKPRPKYESWYRN